ncbi:MAG TPA: GNAT family N-acetyltransferase [Homoserinimonas sp.]|nr:GNAT family N-acetyltransferase [Homoserinimonas sp.]
MGTVPVRVATPADVDGLVDTVTSAFFDDPLWSPIFPDAESRAAQSSAFWRLSVTSALRYPWMLVTENLESVAVWIPPEGEELTGDEADGLDAFLENLVGRAGADSILAIYDQFEAARPAEPHFYLSLLATHAKHRGRGLGMGLLRENLARIDTLHAPAYLESSNPANNARYSGVGFRSVGEFATATGQVVTTMWRDAR